MSNGNYYAGIGDSVWLFDYNRRVYAPRKPGQIAYPGPLYLGHWFEVKITGETARSWVTEFGRKIAKRNSPSRFSDFAWTYDDVLQFAYIEAHRHLIADAVNRCTNYRELVTIAETLGYEPAGINPPTHKG